MKELKLLDENGNEIKSLTFPRTEVGKKVTQKLAILNTSVDWPIENIQYKSNDPELVVTVPTKLKPMERKEIILEWSPSPSRRKPLDVTNILTGEIIIG